MALSGSFTGTTANQYTTAIIEWSATQDVAGNKSTVTAKLYYKKSSLSNSATSGKWSGIISIGGYAQAFNSIPTEINPGGSAVLVATWSKTLDHNPDGTLSITIYAKGSIGGTTLSSTDVSGSVNLDTIPRASSISCTKVNIESNPTITISRASSSFTHTITYAFGTLTGVIATKTSATSITNWIIPASFYGQIPNNKEGWGTLTCITYNGNTEVGTNSCTFWVGTDESKCKPTVKGTVIDVNHATKKLTGDPYVLVRYCSTAQCTLTATLNKSAGSILQKAINGVAVSSDNNDTLTIYNVEASSFRFYAKDSREYPNEDLVFAKQFIPYIPLTNEATIQRDDPTSGNATLIIEGNYFDDTFGAMPNALWVQYWQDGGESVSVTPTISNNKYKATIRLSGLDYTKSFNFTVVVADAIGPITKKITLQKGIPVFDWGENDFNFNVPVKIDGTLTVGGTTITEAQLRSLLAIIS